MKRTWLPALLILGLSFWFFRNRQEPALEPPKPAPVAASPPAEPEATPAPSGPVEPSGETSAPLPVPAPPRLENPPASERAFALPYVLEDGLAVVEGDIVLGVPVDDGAPEEGQAVVPKMRLWPTRRIPYHIQPNLPDPDRVRQALALFEGTVIEFVPYRNENDVLIFEEGTGHCKSYVGHIGGKQPIWLTPGCGPKEIAHEILHALGFIHEQNRADRDAFVQVMIDNVEEKQRGNFEKFPPEFMQASGLARFDFQSIMIYPDWMFAKTGQTTMRVLEPGQRITPGERLSPADVDRVNRAYSNR